MTFSVGGCRDRSDGGEGGDCAASGALQFGGGEGVEVGVGVEVGAGIQVGVGAEEGAQIEAARMSLGAGDPRRDPGVDPDQCADT